MVFSSARVGRLKYTLQAGESAHGQLRRAAPATTPLVTGSSAPPCWSKQKAGRSVRLVIRHRRAEVSAREDQGDRPSLGIPSRTSEPTVTAHHRDLMNPVAGKMMVKNEEVLTVRDRHCQMNGEYPRFE